MRDASHRPAPGSRLASLMLTVVAAILLFGAMLWADPKERVFVDTLEYTGPTMVVDGVTYVDAEKFSQTMGWTVKKGDNGMSIGDTADTATAPGEGLTVAGKPFAGATKTDSGTLYVSLPDLASALGGSVKDLTQYHTLKATIPGMPTEAALHPAPVRKMVEVKSTGQPRKALRPRPRPSARPSTRPSPSPTSTVPGF